MEVQRLLNPVTAACEKDISDVQKTPGQDARMCEGSAAVPPRIVAEFDLFLKKYTKSRFSRIKSEEYWNDVLRACKTRPMPGYLRPSVLSNKNYYLRLQHLHAVEVDGVEHLVNIDSGKLWIHENQVLFMLWPMIQESFKFESASQQEQHVMNVCELFDNVSQRIVFKLYKLAKYYSKSPETTPKNTAQIPFGKASEIPRSR